MPRSRRRFTFEALALSTMLALYSTAACADVPPDESLTKYGITLYGTLDIGVAYQSHGNDFNDKAATNVNNFLTKSNNHSNFSLASNGMSISILGLKGREPLADGVWGIFQLETGYLPASGRLIDGPGSIADSNGVPLDKQQAYGDSTRAGQVLQGRAVIGIDTTDYGTLTFGRNSTLLNDAICKFDPMGCSLNFSYVGFFGATAGVGDTEDRFLDKSLKYTLQKGPVFVGGLYQFGDQNGLRGNQGDAYQIAAGGTFGSFSMQAIYARKNDGILVAGPLSATQVVGLSTPGSAGYGLDPGNTLPGIVSDNTSMSLGAEYDVQALKFFGAYERIRYTNPQTPLPIGSETIGGYNIIPNNNAYARAKIFQIAWAGLRYAVTSRVDLYGAYYYAWQDSYSGNGCSDTSSPQCSGHYETLSATLDYKFNHHFDVYGGVQWVRGAGGIVSGYLNRQSFDPMVGVRLQF